MVGIAVEPVGPVELAVPVVATALGPVGLGLAAVRRGVVVLVGRAVTSGRSRSGTRGGMTGVLLAAIRSVVSWMDLMSVGRVVTTGLPPETTVALRVAMIVVDPDGRAAVAPLETIVAPAVVLPGVTTGALPVGKTGVRGVAMTAVHLVTTAVPLAGKAEAPPAATTVATPAGRTAPAATTVRPVGTIVGIRAGRAAGLRVATSVVDRAGKTVARVETTVVRLAVTTVGPRAATPVVDRAGKTVVRRVVMTVGLRGVTTGVVLAGMTAVVRAGVVRRGRMSAGLVVPVGRTAGRRVGTIGVRLGGMTGVVSVGRLVGMIVGLLGVGLRGATIAVPRGVTIGVGRAGMIDLLGSRVASGLGLGVMIG